MPVAFVPHGGGPWPFVEMGLPRDEVAQLSRPVIRHSPRVSPPC
jgi:hypothetical protein